MAGAGLSQQEISETCQQILNAELQNPAIAGRDFQVDLQKGKRPNHPELDTAPGPLITGINANLLNSTGYQLFHALLDNYNMQTGATETMTPEKEREISQFLDYVIASPPMRVAHQFLASKNLVAGDVNQFKDQLHQMWFRFYTRETRDDTCGFEHVFVGEIDKGEVSGLHNWLQFANLERKGSLDYRGYIFPKRNDQGEVSPVTPSDLIISVQFNINNVVKDVSSMWLGTTPEFELALYTLCFVAGSQSNVVRLHSPTGEYEVEIRCYRIRSKYGDKIGSAFPVLLSKAASQATQENFQQPSQQFQPQGYAPPQQQTYYPPSQGQSGNANQGCGNIFAEIVKSLFQAFFYKK